MGEIKAFFEQHPYLTGSAILAIIVLFLVSRSGGSSSSGGTVTTVNAGPSDAVQVAQLQASTQAAATQAAAQSQQNQLNAQLAAKQLDNATDVTISNMTLQYNLEKLKSDSDTQNNANNFAYLAQLDKDTSQLADDKFNTSAQVQINKQNNDASVAVVKSNNSLWQSIYSAILGSQNTSSVPIGNGPGPGVLQAIDPYQIGIPDRTGPNSPVLPRLNNLR